MEIEKGVLKRINNKRFNLKNTTLCGVVVRGNQDIVIVLFDNGIKKIYTRSEFDKNCLITSKIKNGKEYKLTIEDKDFQKKMTEKIITYINKHFKRDVIELKGEIHKNKRRVMFNGCFCGYISFGKKSISICFKTVIPPPALSRYLYKRKGNEYYYKFSDTSRSTNSDLYIAINWLLLVGKEKMTQNEQTNWVLNNNNLKSAKNAPFELQDN